MKTKSRRLILPATILLLFSLAILSSASYAWFSMTKTATATGMELKTTAPSAMIITDDVTDVDSWSNSISVGTTGEYTPVSSTDGRSFFATDKGQYIGAGGIGGIIGAENTGLKVSAVATPTGYYAEIPLYIRAVNAGDTTVDYDMILSDFEVSATPSNDLQKCVRISISQVTNNSRTGVTGPITFNADGTVATANVTEVSTVVYKYDGEVVKPIASVSGTTAALAADDPAKMTSDTTKTTCFTLDYQGVYYSTIVVRIWIEGQHSECLNDVAKNTITVSLELAVKPVVTP